MAGAVGVVIITIIGFADVKGHYGHPFFHAAKRRNCDGDIDAFLLLLDGVLNFSKAFLSGHRGGMMDAPVILTMRINPSEIDKESLGFKTLSKSAIPVVRSRSINFTASGLRPFTRVYAFFDGKDVNAHVTRSE